MTSFVRLSLTKRVCQLEAFISFLDTVGKPPFLGFKVRVADYLCINSGVLSVSAIPLKERLELKVVTWESG